jgi:hypothetical protein
MQVHKCVRTLLLCVLATAAGACSATSSTDPRPFKPVALANIDAFPAEYREAVQTVAGSLAENGERPEQFYADVQPEEDGQILIFHLWHESAFEPQNRGVAGNPGGKCRDVQYDGRQRRVTQSLFWQ